MSETATAPTAETRRPSAIEMVNDIRNLDQHGNVLDVLVQSRRNAVAAKRFFRKLCHSSFKGSLAIWQPWPD